MALLLCGLAVCGFQGSAQASGVRITPPGHITASGSEPIGSNEWLAEVGADFVATQQRLLDAAAEMESRFNPQTTNYVASVVLTERGTLRTLWKNPQTWQLRVADAIAAQHHVRHVHGTYPWTVPELQKIQQSIMAKQQPIAKATGLVVTTISGIRDGEQTLTVSGHMQPGRCAPGEKILTAKVSAVVGLMVNVSLQDQAVPALAKSVAAH